MDDGSEEEYGLGDIGYVSPGHNAWVVGDEQFSAMDITGAESYAKYDIKYPYGLLAVELSNRLPNVSCLLVDQCLDEMVDRQLLRYSDESTGSYRYRITYKGKRYLALFIG